MTSSSRPSFVQVTSAVLLLGTMLGCASISSQRLTPETKRAKGIPIAVQQPTHAMFLVKESLDGSGNVIDAEVLSQTPILLGEAELFALDLKRPAAGSIEYELNLANQYPTKISGKVTDLTIQTISQAIQDIMKTAKDMGMNAPAGGGVAAMAVPVMTRVRFYVFSLSNPTALTILP